MKIIRLHETGVHENSRLIREAFLHASVSGCGMAEFAPGLVAHEGERHVHQDDEVFVILSGEITVPATQASEIAIPAAPESNRCIPVPPITGEVARAGDWIFIEAGLEHHLTNHTILPCTAMYLVLNRKGND